MALERDYEAERLGRIDLLLVEAKQMVGKVALDRSVSERLRTRLGGEALKEWGLEWLTHPRRFP
jgi:hypothetical protein